MDAKMLTSRVLGSSLLEMTGDDCISIGPGTKNLWIVLVIALGTWISIESLAKDLKRGGPKCHHKKDNFWALKLGRASSHGQA
ncbi:hypothetical protein Gotur_022883 [Gossypium turneri]